MTTHSSATVRETPHATEISNTTISNSLCQRAQSVMHDTSIDERWRAVIRYGLEINDPWLAELVGRAEGKENIEDTFESIRCHRKAAASMLEHRDVGQV